MDISDVNLFYSAPITLESGARSAIGHLAIGGPNGEVAFARLSASPDNYPSSVMIVEEWSFTDADGKVWIAIRYQNNGPNTVVFRSKRMNTGVYLRG